MPNTTYPSWARIINAITALTGILSSGFTGFALLFLGIMLVFGIYPPFLALLAIALLYWGCGSYGAAFTRFERFSLPRLAFQTCMMGVLVAVACHCFRTTHPPDKGLPEWHASAATTFLVFSIIALLSHLLSFAIHLLYSDKQNRSLLTPP